jgi:hypothetical protein
MNGLRKKTEAIRLPKLRAIHMLSNMLSSKPQLSASVCSMFTHALLSLMHVTILIKDNFWGLISFTCNFALFGVLADTTCA